MIKRAYKGLSVDMEEVSSVKTTTEKKISLHHGRVNDYNWIKYCFTVGVVVTLVLCSLIWMNYKQEQQKELCNERRILEAECNILRNEIKRKEMDFEKEVASIRRHLLLTRSDLRPAEAHQKISFKYDDRLLPAGRSELSMSEYLEN